ncbi:MAG TPA: hypothetical protein VIJ28_08875 [Chloroflexota bacterium]
MIRITVMLAIAAPLLHSRMRAITVNDPGMFLVYDTLNGLDAVEHMRDLAPRVVLCDRQMLADPDFVGLQIARRDRPLVVLVTVNCEGIPPRSPIALAGTVPFNTRAGDLASRLRAILHIEAAKPELTAIVTAPVFIPSPEAAQLNARFTVPDSSSLQPDHSHGGVAVAPVPGQQPVPTKTAHLKKTSFLKSVLEDLDPAHQPERASFLSR